MNLTEITGITIINHDLGNQEIEMSMTVRNNKRKVPPYLVLASAVYGKLLPLVTFHKCNRAKNPPTPNGG
jgi:hypothetical protein